MDRGSHHGDLLAVGCWLGLVNAAVLLPVLSESVLRPLLVVPFLLVGPGYAVVAALFPEQFSADRSLSVPSRLVLGFGASVGVVLVVGIGLDFSVFGFGELPVLVGTTVLTLAALAVAVVRRRRVESPAGISLGAAREQLRGVVGDRPTDLALSAAVCLSLVLAAGAVYGLPAADGTPAEAYLLTPGADGAVADDYPSRLEQGEPTTLILGAESGTDRQRPVTAVVTLQRLAEDGTVSEQTELRRLTFDDPASGTAQVEHTITPTVSGELRLTYAVYFGGEPAGSPDRQVHLQVTVTES
ncbi:DUF1616 domain-containing protein [Haloarcula sp. GH36]|uniref:DUF1616 domain-containing protein n=1 Tax=Haloarcula montana TaxID=3111776 RepID=UPI002D79309D|nr:DUF1616 domain-containing protein [Haloarcula sp. GH36]